MALAEAVKVSALPVVCSTVFRVSALGFQHLGFRVSNFFVLGCKA